jgi:hypothetical protein
MKTIPNNAANFRAYLIREFYFLVGKILSF